MRSNRSRLVGLSILVSACASVFLFAFHASANTISEGFDCTVNTNQCKMKPDLLAGLCKDSILITDSGATQCYPIGAYTGVKSDPIPFGSNFASVGDFFDCSTGVCKLKSNLLNGICPNNQAVYFNSTGAVFCIAISSVSGQSCPAASMQVNSHAYDIPPFSSSIVAQSSVVIPHGSISYFQSFACVNNAVTSSGSEFFDKNLTACDLGYSPSSDGLTCENTSVWSVGEYGACSATCGGGTQSRAVVCHSKDGNLVDDSLCISPKPALSQVCNIQACVDPVSLILTGAVTYATATDPDGNVYKVGYYLNYHWSPDQNGYMDAFVAKENPSGVVQWTRVMGGARGDGGSAIIYKDGFLYLGGSFCNGKTNVDGATDFNGNTFLGKDGHGWHSGDGWLSRFDLNGNQLWIKTYENIGDGFSNQLYKDDVITSIQPFGSTISVGGPMWDCWTGNNYHTFGFLIDPITGTRTDGYLYTWSMGVFSACSATCGGGTQTRTVACKRNDGVISADIYCSVARPAESQACNTQACP